LPGLLSHFKPNGLSCLLLANGRPIYCIAVGRDILDFQCNDIASPKLAIDGQVEQRKVPRFSLCLEFAPYGPDMLRRSGGLAPVSFPLFHGRCFGGKIKIVF